ncbi:MAG: hypothetical protein DWI06_04210 [Planctomycetota bacterium]|nr:MAG: hypothetical protein DWI06_04210 [Planctomycetota bacterium]
MFIAFITLYLLPDCAPALVIHFLIILAFRTEKNSDFLFEKALRSVWLSIGLIQFVGKCCRGFLCQFAQL